LSHPFAQRLWNCNRRGLPATCVIPPTIGGHARLSSLIVSHGLDPVRELRPLSSWLRLVGLPAGKQVHGLLPHYDVAAGRREDGLQTDTGSFATDAVPGYPNAVGRSQVGFTIVLRELSGRKRVLAVGSLPEFILIRVVIGVDDQLPFHGYGLVLLVIEIQPPAETSHRSVAGHCEHIRRPDGC
jgi:hypothetical protein